MGIDRRGGVRCPFASPKELRGRLPMDRSRGGQGEVVSRGDLPHAHVLGIPGRGLFGLAQSLVQSGMIVTASEDGTGAAVAQFQEAGARSTSVPRAFSGRTRLLIHGPEIPREHSARLGALRRGIRQETPAAWLGGLMAGRVGVAVVGGREASVAAAMIGFVLERAGMDPSVVLGRSAPQLGGWARGGCGPHLVAEWTGDAEGFGVLRPRVAVLMHVESDPWIDHERWVEAFRRFVKAVPDDSHVLALGHPSLIEDEPRAVSGPGRFDWVSLQRGGDWWGTDLREESGRFRFRVFHRGRYVIEIRLLARGRRNVLGALAAVAACDRLGVAMASVREGLEEFTGLARDFQMRGSFRGVSLVDDEAREPAAVEEALTLARRAFGSRRLWAVFAPPETAPGLSEQGRFASAFSIADRVLIAEDKGATSRVSSARILTRALTTAGVRASRVSSLAEAISELDRNIEPGDVLLTLGAGDVGTIADAFIRRLPRDHQGG
jgi:UDP-N-acetylmuramate--alanine ligase